MLQYMLIVLLHAIIYCTASENTGTDTAIDKLADKPLPTNTNGNPVQQIIYIYGSHQWRVQNAKNIPDIAGSGYLITPGVGAHKLHVRKLPWYKARRICHQEGGHLAIINSDSEEKLLIHILEENKVNQAWLGVHDLYEEGDWNTIMDEPLESTGYSKWTSKIPNEPDNHNGKQHCGSLLKDGGMDDLECTATIAFFCEIVF